MKNISNPWLRVCLCILLITGAEIGLGQASFALSASSAALLRAAQQGELAVVKRAVRQSANINARDRENDTPLMLAAKTGRIQVVQYLLKRGASVKARNERQQTALHLAARGGHAVILRLLLNHGANVNARDNAGDSVLFDATYVTAPASNFSDPKRQRAAYSRCWAVVKLLIDAHADVNLKNSSGEVPLVMAPFRNCDPITKVLIAKTKDVNARAPYPAMTALERAIANGDRQSFWALLAKGADPNIHKETNAPLLVMILVKGSTFDVRAFKALLQHGADVQVRAIENWTPVLAVLFYKLSDKDFPEYFKLLMDRHADVRGKADTGDTALTLIADHGHAAGYVKTLLERGAEVNVPNARGETPLLLAAHEGDLDSVKLLLAHGANVHLKDDHGREPFFYAIADRQVSVAMQDALLKSGADINAQDKEGYTALMGAAELPDATAGIKNLLAHGADVNLRDKEGKTALQIAEEREANHTPGSYEYKQFAAVVDILRQASVSP